MFQILRVPVVFGLLAPLGLMTAGCSGTSDKTADADETAFDAWTIEQESREATVTFADGVIDVDTPKGLTLWFNDSIEIPAVIEFDVMAVDDGGPNDHVSDINAFWMASNADGTSVLSRPRSGAFAEYDTMLAYYVGIGGNRNTTTRLRRYVGEAGNRPILPDHDLGAPEFMITPNKWTRITLVAGAEDFSVKRDGEPLFTYALDMPYTKGHFGLRTTKSHLRYRNIRIGEHRGN